MAVAPGSGLSYNQPSYVAPASKKSTPAPAAISETRSDDQIRKLFPQYAWLLNDPQIHAILTNVKDFPDAQAIANGIVGTDYWRHTESAQRAYDLLVNTDPESLNQQKRTKEAQVWDLYNQIGLT